MSYKGGVRGSSHPLVLVGRAGDTLERLTVLEAPTAKMKWRITSCDTVHNTYTHFLVYCVYNKSILQAIYDNTYISVCTRKDTHTFS